jgi:8-oxo-dGTP diphosphatase
VRHASITDNRVFDAGVGFRPDDRRITGTVIGADLRAGHCHGSSAQFMGDGGGGPTVQDGGTTIRQGRKISVYGVCRDDAGRLLLVQAAATSSFPGSWNLPGGGIEHGESPVGALRREFAEETGFGIAIGALVDVRSDVVRAPAGDRIVHVDRIVFDVEPIGGSLRAETGGSTDDVAWFTRDELAQVPLLPWLAAFLDYPGPRPLDPAIAAATAVEVRDPAAVRFQRFSVYGVVRDPAGRVLLTRIAPGYPGAGHWHLPGGGTDFGETARDGLLREVREETGQKAEIGDLREVVHMHNPHAYGPEQRPIDWHTVRAIFDAYVPEPTDPFVDLTGGSTDQVAWFTPAEVRQLKLNRLAQAVLVDHT